MRSINRKRLEEEPADADANLSPQDKFCTGVFLAIIDSMTGAFKNDWALARNLFWFLHEILI